MTRTELPWLLLGRLVRPFPLAASVACTLMSLNIWLGSSIWGGTEDPLSAVTAVGGLVAAALLWGGWWGRSTALMQHGLMFVAVLFAMRGATIWLEGSPITAGLSLSWTLAAGGAWLLERTTGGWDVYGGRRRLE